VRVRAGARLYIFHGTLNKEWMEDLLEEIGIVGAVLKDLGQENLDRISYSRLWCTLEFYDNFPTTHLLCFQTDVLMRRRIPEKFFRYDYVGAPWTECVPPIMKESKASGCPGINLHGVRDPLIAYHTFVHSVPPLIQSLIPVVPSNSVSGPFTMNYRA